MNATLSIPGPPATKGSWRLGVSKNGKPYVRPSCTREKAWSAEIAAKAREQIRQPWDGPVGVSIFVYFHRPKSQAGHTVQTSKPDADKIARAVLDALTGIAYHDDAQVSHLRVTKRYCLGTDDPETIIQLFGGEP